MMIYYFQKETVEFEDSVHVVNRIDLLLIYQAFVAVLLIDLPVFWLCK